MYENFAEFYDVLMTANYAEWIDSVSEYLCGKTGVDLACGTGKFTIGLIKRGFDVVGVDISAEMLAKAYENALREKIKANFTRYEGFCSIRKAGFLYLYVRRNKLYK